MTNNRCHYILSGQWFGSKRLSVHWNSDVLLIFRSKRDFVPKYKCETLLKTTWSMPTGDWWVFCYDWRVGLGLCGCVWMCMCECNLLQVLCLIQLTDWTSQQQGGPTSGPALCHPSSTPNPIWLLSARAVAERSSTVGVGCRFLIFLFLLCLK